MPNIFDCPRCAGPKSLRHAPCTSALSICAAPDRVKPDGSTTKERLRAESSCPFMIWRVATSCSVPRKKKLISSKNTFSLRKKPTCPCKLAWPVATLGPKGVSFRMENGFSASSAMVAGTLASVFRSSSMRAGMMRRSSSCIIEPAISTSPPVGARTRPASTRNVNRCASMMPWPRACVMGG